MSEANNLDPTDDDRIADIYLFDFDDFSVKVVSIASNGTKGNGTSNNPMISANGRYVAFESLAANLVPNDNNDVSDIFVHDLETGQTVRVSVDVDGGEASGPSMRPSISFDGNVVVFESEADNLIPDDGNGVLDIFAHNQLTGNTWRISVDSNGEEADAPSDFGRVTDSGQAVVFRSLATNLVPDDTNDIADIFLAQSNRWHHHSCFAGL